MAVYTGRRRRFSKRGYIFIACVLLLIVGIISVSAGVRAGRVKAVMAEFNEQYAAGNYTQARMVWNGAKNTLRPKQLAKVEAQIQEKLQAELVALITPDNQLQINDPTVLALREFATETQPLAMERLGVFVQGYVDRQVAFKSVWLYILNMRTVGYEESALSGLEQTLLKHYDSRNYLNMGQQYDVSGNAEAALECYRRVIPEETEDYAYAQQRISVLGGQLQTGGQGEPNGEPSTGEPSTGE